MKTLLWYIAAKCWGFGCFTSTIRYPGWKYRVRKWFRSLKIKIRPKNLANRVFFCHFHIFENHRKFRFLDEINIFSDPIDPYNSSFWSSHKILSNKICLIWTGSLKYGRAPEININRSNKNLVYSVKSNNSAVGLMRMIDRWKALFLSFLTVTHTYWLDRKIAIVDTIHKIFLLRLIFISAVWPYLKGPVDIKRTGGPN